MTTELAIALDVPGIEEAKPLLGEVGELVDVIKIHSFANRVGIRQAVKFLRPYGAKLFWDGKWFDAPDTMADNAKLAAELEIDFITVHALSTQDHLEAVTRVVPNRVKVIAVTYLTTHDDNQLLHVFRKSVDITFRTLVFDAHAAGVGGYTCAVDRVRMLRGMSEGQNVTIVTPGIRPKWSVTGKQKRAATPRDAIVAGSNMIVIGQPLTNPPSDVGTPAMALKLVRAEMAQAAQERTRDALRL